MSGPASAVEEPPAVAWVALDGIIWSSSLDSNVVHDRLPV